MLMTSYSHEYSLISENGAFGGCQVDFEVDLSGKSLRNACFLMLAGERRSQPARKNGHVVK